MFLTFDEIKFYLVYDDCFKLCALDEDREGAYEFEEFFYAYEIELEAIKELEELVEASAQQAVKQFWFNFIKTEYEKLNEDNIEFNLSHFESQEYDDGDIVEDLFIEHKIL